MSETESAKKLFFEALEFFDSGDFKKAELRLRDALHFTPHSVSVLTNLSVILLRQNKFCEAREYAERVISASDNNIEALFVLVACYQHDENFSEVLSACDKIIAMEPNNIEAHNNRGLALAYFKRFAEALDSYEHAIALNSKTPEPYNNRGNVLRTLGRYAEALDNYERAIKLKPEFADAWVGKGNAFSELKRYDEAVIAYNKALALKPDLAAAWLGRGNVFSDLERYDDAFFCYEKAIDLKHGYAEAYFNMSLVKLSLGNFDEGWALYEWRWKTPEFREYIRKLSQNVWLGNDSIVGKTILVHSEQGFGDIIHFCRYLQKLKTLGCKIIFEVPAPIVPLFSAQGDNLFVIAKGNQLPKYDVYCPLMSLPLAFKTTLKTIPALIPYLTPAPERLEKWRTKLGRKNKLRIGLAWSGNPEFKGADSKRVALESLLPMINRAAEWHSLQKDVRESDRGRLNSSLAVIDHATSLNDFSDTAALIAEMDIVISIDTAVAHLAGALGKPVWILLPFHPDFRWLRDREDSPWYPTARLFRQTKDGEWEGVIDRVSQELKIFLAAS